MRPRPNSLVNASLAEIILGKLVPSVLGENWTGNLAKSYMKQSMNGSNLQHLIRDVLLMIAFVQFDFEYSKYFLVLSFFKA